VWAHEYYRLELPPAGADLSDTSSIRKARIEPDVDTYYASRGIAPTAELAVPASAAVLFDRFYALDEDVKLRFLRACHWYGQGRFLYGRSPSLSFASFVVAIESLLDNARQKPHDCSACGLPHHPSISATFRTFVAKYVPEKSERETFYALRSQIVHGSRVLHGDLAEGFMEFEPSTILDNTQRDEVVRVCRRVLVNWLADQPPA
jgi:hypothetical protein